MDTLIPYLAWAVVILIGLGIVAMGAFGLRNVVYGKVSILTIIIVSIPILLLFVFGFLTNDWSYAAIITALLTLLLGLIALGLAAIRSMVGL
jgi:hypothetical protein